MRERASKELAGIVGEDDVFFLSPAEGLSARDGSRPLLVRPGTIEETGEVVAVAHRHGWKVLSRGAGTRPLPAPSREPIDLVVEITRLDRVVEHYPEDLVASVECGIYIRECQRILGLKGQRIPLDPPTARGATIGSVLATNSFGPRRLRFGTARDWVIGTTLVRFDGKLVHAGGMVVKNVSGYDLSKLYIGSWGTLGILVRANFKLDPLPAAEGMLVLDVPDRRTAWRIVDAARVQLLPLDSAVLVHGRRSMAPLPHSKPGTGGTTRLFLGLEGIPGVLERQAETLSELAEREGSSGCRWTTGEETEHLRKRLGDAQTELEAALQLRMSYPSAAYESIMEGVEAVRGSEGFSEFSLLGSGVTWLGWREAGPTERCVELVDRLREICSTHHGWLMVERQPPDCSEVVRAWRIPPGGLKVMSEIKAALDPTGTFTSGPFLQQVPGE